MKRVVVGLLAHVDAGKTTLIESMLHTAGVIRTKGRVDHKDSYLDFDPMERDRGITIYSKQAILEHGNTSITLLDTPGHVDFCAEAERTLAVLDLAVLLVGANDGITGHTKTLLKLLERYGVPSVVFFNKMDLAEEQPKELLDRFANHTNRALFEYGHATDDSVQERLALCDEAALDELLEQGTLKNETLQRLVQSRKACPCLFGSALHDEGVDRLLDAIANFAPACNQAHDFGAVVYKVSHEGRGSRVAWLKVTGDSIKAKSLVVGTTPRGDTWEDKIDQVRVYTGERYAVVQEVPAGGVCAVTGLSKALPGDGIGAEVPSNLPMLLPVLDYAVLPQNCDAHAVHMALIELADEDPLLGVAWDEELQEVRVSLMGVIQQEIVQRVLTERYGLQVAFGPGAVLYKETVREPALGIGHYEPLKHYAEVHVRIEPDERGSGVSVRSECSEDELARNWQRLIATHVMERVHRGVLTGAPLTDVCIVLVAGRAHKKHTEGGDFRQATYRAIRQGLMQAKSELLEPWYDFSLELPANKVGRALSDLQRMDAAFDAPQVMGEWAVVEGKAPVATIRDYPLLVSSYTGGEGHLLLEFGGYASCHNASEVIEQAAYDPEADLAHTPDSVFCSHGAGYTVKWYDVAEHAHV